MKISGPSKAGRPPLPASFRLRASASPREPTSCPVLEPIHAAANFVHAKEHAKKFAKHPKTRKYTKKPALFSSRGRHPSVLLSSVENSEHTSVHMAKTTHVHTRTANNFNGDTRTHAKKIMSLFKFLFPERLAQSSQSEFGIRRLAMILTHSKTH